MKNNIILSHPTGNTNVRAAAQGILMHHQLYRFYTTVACYPNAWYYPLLKGFLGAFRKRTFDQSLKPYISTYPFYELGRFLAGALKKNDWLAHEAGRFSIDQVYQTLDAHVAHRLRFEYNDASAIYSYEDGALKSFEKAKQLGLKTCYDLPIGYWKTARILMEEEMNQRPEWASTFTGFKDSEAKLARKDEELALADHIFVASSFTQKTLGNYPGPLAEVSVIPYGFPIPFHERKYVSLKSRKLRLLFVGGLSQRKGIANVLEAVAGLEQAIELTIIGRKVVEDCIPLSRGLTRHRYIPALPNDQILREMREHDVLLFPSLFEGFGLVITEAMSQGTPVITTNRTVGPDIITHNKNGWLVEAGNTAALKNQIEALLFEPELIKANGIAAMETARKRPWTKYGTELAQKIVEIIGEN